LPTVDELSLVGYPDDVEISQLFEKTGMYYVTLLHTYVMAFCIKYGCFTGDS